MASEKANKRIRCKVCHEKTYAVPGRKGLCLRCFCKKVSSELNAYIDRVTSQEYINQVNGWDGVKDVVRN